MSPREIKNLRGALGLTQEEFATELCITRVTLARWEVGANAPKGLYLRALEDFAKKAKKKVKTRG
jgi:DNA-binding transcriptional regulator YiaG